MALTIDLALWYFSYWSIKARLMWLFFKSLFMVKDRSIAKEMVSDYKFNSKPAGFKLARLMRRRARRNKFKAHNTTNLKFKVK